MVSSVAHKPIEILLIEDNEDDIIFTQKALEKGKVLVSLNTVQDGAQAMGFLRKSEEYAAAPRPSIILLDLNLPGKDGREILAEIKEDESLKKIPVVVLTTSAAEQDIVKSYNLHANSYVVKPLDLAGFITVIQSLEDFWFGVVELPPAH